MNIPKSFLIFSLLLLSSTELRAASGLDAIYKKDDRQFISKSTPAKIKELSKSVALIVDKKRLKDSIISTNKLNKPNGFNVCLDENFSNSNSVAGCTGFLVAPDLLVSAGHCFLGASDCEDQLVIFGVHDSDATSNGYRVKNSNIYHCKEIVSRAMQGDSDFSIIRLDRKAKNLKSLKIRESGEINLNEKVFMIGHPLGMPLMLSPNAHVKDISSDIFFRADLDSFSGNSGSPVFNQRTLEVEGILVRGQNDFYEDKENRCKRMEKYFPLKGLEKSGEDVMRINSVLDVVKNDMAAEN